MRLIDKIKKMGSLLILSTCCLTSCNFLDVVPPEQAGLGDAVKKPESTLGFLYFLLCRNQRFIQPNYLYRNGSCIY